MAVFSKVVATVLVAAIAISAVSTEAKTVDLRVLLLCGTDSGCDAIQQVLDFYEQPYDVRQVTAAGVSGALGLESDPVAKKGKYSGIIISPADLVYPNSEGLWLSVLTPAQWTEINNYQVNYGANRINIGSYPNWETGTFPADASNPGCCTPEEEGTNPQMIGLGPAAGALQGLHGVLPTATFSSQGLWHYPTTITRPEIATPFLTFSPMGTRFPNPTLAATIATYPTPAGNRTELNVHFSVASWSVGALTSLHVLFAWLSKGVYLGSRRAFTALQVDDLFLSTETWDPVLNAHPPDGARAFRARVSDLQILRSWQATVSKLLPTGSGNFKLEMAYNGNGVLEMVDQGLDYYVSDDKIAPNTFQKPLGTGTNVWSNPAPAKGSAWNNTALLTTKDKLFDAVVNGGYANDFYWLSHTYTHLNLNNVTTWDAQQEIRWNKDFANIAKLTGHVNFSPNSMVTPQISGVRNGDALNTIVREGITSIVGDTSRPDTMNPFSITLPFITNSSYNGYNGMVVLPRFPTDVYYDVSTIAEWVSEYNHIYTTVLNLLPTSTVTDILKRNVDRAMRDVVVSPINMYMFHQANLRVADLGADAQFTVNGRSVKLGTLQTWAEHFIQAYRATFSWPLRTVKQDAVANMYRARRARFNCKPSATIVVDDVTSTVKQVAVRATTGTASCNIEVSLLKSLAVNIGAPAGSAINTLANEPTVINIKKTRGEVDSTMTINQVFKW